MDKNSRRLARQGDLYGIDLNGERVELDDVPTDGKPIRVKSVDGWWQRRAKAMRKPTGYGETPLERRIARGISKATGNE